VVTGGASGIGRALASELARQGARVVLVDRNEPLLAEATAEIEAAGRSAEARPADVSDAAAVAALIAGVRSRHGRIDYLFNNAGIAIIGEAKDLDLADWNRVLSVNLWGVIHGVAAVYPVMIEQGFGHIVNTASLAGLGPAPGLVPYGTSKHAVVGLSVGLRAEAALHGVRVSVVCPGLIDTPISRNAEYRNLDREKLLSRLPVRPYPVDKCAREILRGVARNEPVIVVTPYARLMWRLYRLFPWVLHRYAEREARKAADMRKE
jgi:NAD(P)-dependent dehydrogenase (short-subunit alcohol dehydrogenase family)